MALEEIFSARQQADKVIERSLKSQKKWGSRDRRFFAESCYEIVRHWRRLGAMAGYKELLSEENLSRQDFWKIWARYQWEKVGELPDWAELSGLRWVKPEEPLSRAVRESIPDWLDQWGSDRFGSQWDEILAALNRPADVYLRVNTLKADRARAHQMLLEEGLETEILGALESCLRLPVRKNVFLLKAFHQGIFEVQDAASQTVAPLLDVEPGMRVIDACAGGGGKTLHLAALMKNKGKIIAMDVHEWKLKELKIRTRRAGVDIVETRVIESAKTIKRLEASADRVLLDVPCSGLGVLRRNPDAKWRLQPDEIHRLMALQRDILSTYSKMVKPGGRLVYATCSLLPDENEMQVRDFLQSESGRDWTLEEEMWHRPDLDGWDGFYGARLQRTRST